MLPHAIVHAASFENLGWVHSFLSLLVLLTTYGITGTFSMSFLEFLCVVGSTIPLPHRCLSPNPWNLRIC